MATPKLVRRLLHPAYRSLETSAHILRYLFIEITQRCNLSCLHCGSDCTREAQLEELSTEEWLKFFAYLKASFDTRELVLVVTGGEPFCCPRFDEILEGISANGLAWGMVTNGWALTAANVGTVVAHRASSMTVSLDGMRESHDWLRGKKGSFDRATEGIRRVVAADLPFFDVVTCVNPRNLDELPAVLAHLQGLGVKAWRLFSIFPKGRAKTNPDIRLSEDGLRKLFAWMRETRLELEGSGFSLQFSCEGYLPAKLDQQVRDEPYFCRAGINVGSVLCDGAIGACPNITRTLVQGNIRQDDFKQVWEDRFQPFRDRAWMRKGPCVECKQWRSCKGNSLHLWDDQAEQTALCHHRILSAAGS